MAQGFAGSGQSITISGPALSAGTQSGNTGTIVFANSNGVTFGMSDSSQITASVNAAGGSPNFSAGTTSNNLGSVVFSDANNISFGLDGSTITGSVLRPAFSADVSSTFRTLTLQDSNGISFSNNAGAVRITHGLQYTSATSAITSNAMHSTSRPAFSADASSTFQTLTLQDSNGISFSNNAGAIRLTHGLQYTSATSAITSNALNTSAYTGNIYHVGNTTGQSSSSSYDKRTLSFDGAGIVSVGWSGGSVRISATQSNQAFSADASSTFQTLTLQDSNGISFSNNAGAIRLTHGLQYTSATSAITSNALNTSAYTGNIYHVGNTTGQSSSSSYDKRTLSFDGAGIVSVGWSGGSVRISATQSNQAFSADASSTFQTLTFQNSNGVSFSNNAGAIRLTHDLQYTSATSAITSNAMKSTEVAASASNGSFSFKTINFSNANNVTFGTSAGGIVTASVAAPGAAAENNWFTLAGNVTGNSSASGSTINLSALSGITVSGTNDSVIKIYGYPHQSYHAIPAGGWFGNSVWSNYLQSTSVIVPIVLSLPLSMDSMRVIVSASVAASSTQATTGNTSLSAGGTTSLNIVIYSRGTGASSMSLQSVTSSQDVWQQAITWSAGANSTQHSVSNRVTFGTYSGTFDYSSSAASFNYHTSNLTALTGNKIIDADLGISLSPGQYWVAVGATTSTATQNGSVSVMTRMLVTMSNSMGASMNTNALGFMGAATNSSLMFAPAHGSFSIAGGGTTASIDMTRISSNASNLVPYFQFFRIA